ncbi:UBA/TS-N domain-containing protein [Myxozyma melibiosi]|uniref:UBA/TS-N domain-containing protein n=1 Tax=Myxozyma melibiosi TaxID=54550 RepID=A0ABR1EYI7_9ASCO
MDVRNQLVEMGFPVSRIEAALRNTSPATLESCVEWLDQHPIDAAVQATGDPDDDSTEVTVGPDGEPIEKGDMSDAAGSLVCQDCGKRFRTPATAEYHATRTNHTNFAESTEKIPELTPEQKAAKLEELRLRAAERKATQAKIDALENRNNENLRKKADKDSAAAIERQKKLQVQKEAEARRREQREEVLAKQRIKDLIAADKKARQEKLERERAARAGVAAPSQPSAQPTVTTSTPATPRQKKEYTESRLQIRVDGQSPIVKTFPVETTLFEIAHSVQDVSGVAPDSAVFVTTFPTKRYGAEDMGMTIKEAGFINTAVMLKRA